MGYEDTNTCTYNIPGCVLLSTNRKVEKETENQNQTITTPNQQTSE